MRVRVSSNPYNKMAYEIFKKNVTKEEYFDNWTSSEYDRLTSELKARIYTKYLMKCEVFQRDNFSCQHAGCKNKDSPLTVHHVRFQKNGGEDSTRNCVTLCRACHQAFHRAKLSLVFLDVKHLPKHIRGHTFRLQVSDTINWKKVKAEMKKFRKTLEGSYVRLSWEDIAALLKYLDVDMTEDDD